VERIRRKYGLSERHACRIVGQPRGTQRYTTIVRADEDALTQAIIALASQYGRYGYRRIKSLLGEGGGGGLRRGSTAAAFAPGLAKPERA
jgi:putative transposase